MAYTPKEYNDVIADYVRAYEAANGKTINVSRAGQFMFIGGYGGPSWRMKKIKEATAELRKRPAAAQDGA